MVKLPPCYTHLLLIFVFSILLVGCAQQYTPETVYDPYGFFSGLLHGFIIVFSIIGYFIFDSVYINWGTQ
jgi:hypothetical protein